jgi:hypothetical protein
LICRPFYAVDIPYRKPPFNVFTWLVQVLWMILMAPVECAQGFGKTANTLVLPPDRQLPPMESLKMPKLQAPKLQWPKIPWLAELLGIEDEEKGLTDATPSAKSDPQ